MASEALGEQLIEATNVAHGDARTRVKHMKTRRSGGIGSGRGGTSLLCLFVVIKRGRSGDYTRVCTTFGLGLVKTESDTNKIHQGELCRGNLRPSNERLKHIWGRPTARISEPISQGASAAKRDVSGRAVKSCGPHNPPLVPPGELGQLLQLGAPSNRSHNIVRPH